MKSIVYFLGFGYIAIGTFFILYTRAYVETLKKSIQAVPLKVLATLPAVLGILFFISASATTFPWVFRIISLFAIGKAVFVFSCPHKLYSRLLAWHFELSDQTQRLFGIISVIFGTAVLTWIE